MGVGVGSLHGSLRDNHQAWASFFKEWSPPRAALQRTFWLRGCADTLCGSFVGLGQYFLGPVLVAL